MCERGPHIHPETTGQIQDHVVPLGRDGDVKSNIATNCVSECLFTNYYYYYLIISEKKKNKEKWLPLHNPNIIDFVIKLYDSCWVFF